jgi:integrase
MPARPQRKSKFPLTLHPTGQWCKKIRGKLHYFGTDKQEAHDRYLLVAADLHAGRSLPQKIGSDGLTVKELANHYLGYQEHRIEGGEITARHFRDCREALDMFMKSVGRMTPVPALSPDALMSFRAGLLKKYAPATVNRILGAVKAMFNYGLDAGFIDRIPPVKKTLAKVAAKQLRKHKAAAERERGLRVFTAEEIKAVLAAADPPMKAMILLGLNGGFGNKDCADLEIRDVDFRRSLIDYVRGKTGIRRTVPFWPETITAIRDAIAARPKPRLRSDEKLVFLTPRGYRWVRVKELHDEKEGLKVTAHDELSKQFANLVEDLKIQRKGLGFYALRHTHATLADKSRDLHAQSRIMGHAIPGILGEYVEDIELSRLQKVVDVVHQAVFPPKAEGTTPTGQTTGGSDSQEASSPSGSNPSEASATTASTPASRP